MKLKETISSPFEKGIFLSIKDKFEWLDEDNSSTLNVSYYLGHSGEKDITPLYDKLLENYTEDEALDYLAKLIYATYGKNWNRIYQALEVEYNPIHNYNMEEKISTNTNISTSSKGGSSQKNTSSNSSNETNNTNIQVEQGYYGFNSSTSNPNNCGNNNTNEVIKSEDSGSSNTTIDNINEDVVKGSEEDNYKKTTRSGNIGVTTTQKMLNEELEIRKTIFFNNIMKDLDKLLCLNIY